MNLIIFILGHIHHIHSYLVTSLIWSRSLLFRLQNFNLFSKTPSFWKYLNYKYKVDKSIEINENYYSQNYFYLEIDETWRDSFYFKISLGYIMNGFYKIYLYPEKDFCLFREFPQDKLIEANLTMVELKVNNNFKI